MSSSRSLAFASSAGRGPEVWGSSEFLTGAGKYPVVLDMSVLSYILG